MESWVLEGDSYSFLRSAPRNFNLQHPDGPNRVEIFDITSIPGSRGAISETTCLCDIFGDDCESPSLSSSPASTSFLKREVDPHLPVEDVNDSSGSYHTAHSSEQLSDTSDSFEDSRDSLKRTRDLPLPETGESRESESLKDLTSSNDKIAPENGSPSPAIVNDGDLSHTESQEESNLTQNDTDSSVQNDTDSSAQNDNDSSAQNDTDSSPQLLVTSTSEFRDTNSGVTDSSRETLKSEIETITEQSETASPERKDFSTPPRQPDSPCLDNQVHTVAYEPVDESSPEITPSEASAEESNVVTYPGGTEAKIFSSDVRSNCSSPIENISREEETVKHECSADLTNVSPLQSCPSTPDPSIRALTPASISPPPLMETHIHSRSDVTLQPNVLARSSPETTSHQSAPLADDKPPEEPSEEPPEEPTAIPSPTPAAEDNTEINSSFEHQPHIVSPEAAEIVPSPDPRRSGSFASDATGRLQSPEVSEFCSFVGSAVAAHSSEPSVVIHSPVGYTISPSPEFERRVSTAEPEASASTPEIPETDDPATPIDFRGSVSSHDSKLCLTPESRSIASTPETRQDVLTPSPELRSATCSPEVRVIACSVLPQKPLSPQIQGITYRAVSPQNTVPPRCCDLEGMTCAESPTFEVHVPANSPTSKLASTPENISRASSMTLSLSRDAASSPEIRDQQSPDRFSDPVSVPEPCISLEPTSEEVDLPSFAPDDGRQFSGQLEPFQSCSRALDECRDVAPEALSQNQIIKDPVSVPCGGALSVTQMEESTKMTSESISTLIPHENSWHPASQIMLTGPIAEERDFPEGNGRSSGTEMLERESGAGEKPPVHVPVRPRESPNVFHGDNDRENDRQSCRNKGWSKERVVQEEHTSGKGEENIAEGSYRGEQVELSFRDRNRKGPTSHSAAPSSGDPKSGIPARCYFESPLTTRQQQSLLRAQGLQKENKSGARRVQSASQSKHSGAGRLPSGCTAETSGMGSEFDEADNEVKWFTDLAFRSLSSPQGDYLDVYSSSHRSSTNVSQPSTADSPGAATWMSYADLRASALQESDALQCHTSSFLAQGALDPSRRFEMGSFECVDVAVESREESKRGKRTVPKRQIQLKRRNNEESRSVENAGSGVESPSTQMRSRDVLPRQRSTPDVGHENLSEGETEIETDGKMLQKSASFDGTSTKTKMASTIIKSVLSKKMETKESSRSEDSSPSEDKKKHPEALSAGVSSNLERHSLSSSLASECSLSSEDYAGREDRSPHLQKKSCGPKVPPKPIFKPNFIPASSNSGTVALQGRMPVRDQMRPRRLDRLESKTPPKKQIVRKSEQEAETCDFRERFSRESASVTGRNPTSAATRAASTQNRLANRALEDCATPETPKQQAGRKTFLSKTPEITLKPCTTKDKNKSSLKVSPSPDRSIDETPDEWQTRFKPDTEVENEEDEKPTSRPVMHKVRDVRKLVKNTYNLSFKASNTTHPPVEDQVPQKEKEIHHPQALHIECKAISWKDKQASDKKVSSLKHQTHHPDKSGTLGTSEMTTDRNTIDVQAKTSLPKVTMESRQKTTTVQVSDMDTFVVSNPYSTNTSKPPETTEQSSDLDVPPRPTSKETSRLLFLQDNTPSDLGIPHGKSLSSSHSVSMLLKEKGMQADIGVCDVLNEGVGATPKHINRLEVPLQTCVPEDTSNEPQKAKDKEVETRCTQNRRASIDSSLQTTQCVSLVRSSPKPPKELRISPSGTLADYQGHVASVQPSKEAEKITTHETTHATSVAKPPAPLATSNKVEVRSFSSNAKSHAMPVTTSKEIELPIQVRSVSSDRPKPSVPPKPCYKQPFPEISSTSSDSPKTDIPAISKQQTHAKSDVKKSETSVAVAQKEQSTEVASSNTKKLAVSAVSSYKPPSSSEPKPTTSSVATARQQVSITSVQNPSSWQQLDTTTSEEQVMPVSSTSASSHPVLPVASQSHTYIQPSNTASASNQLHKEDFHFHKSDDPPSYDERESFSPLRLSDLPPRRLDRYHPTNKPSPCSCTTGSHSHPGHPYQGSQNRTPPASRSPGQVLSYPGALPKAQVRPHQCRQDGQPLIYPSVSPKTSAPPAPAMIQPLHHSYPCPAPAAQSFGDEQQPSSTQQMERHPANRRSPQAGSSAAYREHSRSPNIAVDPRSQFFSPHDLPPAFSHDYGSDGPGGGGVLYPENASGLGYGQGPRRVLLDPETGKYFYIEVPMQPLRKMLFDPEIGQYVEVLIPQQAMSHSGMYPPTAAPYPSPLHGPGLYAPQYLPYGAPPHPQSAQQPRHQETSVSTSLHQTSMGYGGSASQTPKSEAKSHPSLDQSYLEGMYYIPTGMNASPNSTPSDCYHKPSPNMPASGGRRA
ncbi:uncharacterized protein [Salminus brasiliensis]|uniref:uncharacterized protein n=1 Tax=Salminus brasiliensis TaxID=930266 RepID=UPI003B8348AC